MSDRQLMTRAAWFYYVAGFNQELTSRRMGLTRARVNKLLGQARDAGVVSIILNDRDLGLLHVEEAIRHEFGLEFCITTPAMGLDAAETGYTDTLAALPLKAVGTAGALFLRDHLAGAIRGHPSATGWADPLPHLAPDVRPNRPGPGSISLRAKP